MSKQKTCQRFIFKIHSARLRKAKWNLTLPLNEARKNEEIISLSDSQILRFIDSMNNITDADEKAKAIKTEIKALKREENTIKNRRKIRELYEKLDEIQFKPDYMCLIIDKNSDYYRACKGFTINGIKYSRLLGTNGGVKNSTIVFVSESKVAELKRRIDNGRNKEKEFVPAKLEAYQALVCSGSIPVSMPKGVAIVNDCITTFKSDVLNISDDNDGEPLMEFQKDAEVELVESDGYGIMLPSLAEKWSEELELDYLVSGVNTRFAWEKGMVFTFDFLDFADNVAGTRVIKDAWGNEVDLSEVELILTTSMVKLWDSYDSCEEYIRNSLENGYTFAVTKTCPKELENERNLNYQFIQSYELSDEDIEKLIKPTVDEIHDILGLDWRKTILFLSGKGVNEDNVEAISSVFAKAIMADQRMINDPFVRKKVLSLIRKRIDDAKIGVIKVHGNYSIVSGDPYSLCQSIFGLPVTGLLKAGEIYNKYWIDNKTEKVACFRAPMSCHNNIRLMRLSSSSEAKYWYRYMNTCTLLNSWDTACAALNGMDKDGDLVLLTDNEVLVNNLRELPAIMCMQRKADKCIPTEEEMIKANINSFGDDIGKITNRVTSMFDVQAQFDKDSPEYKVLDYRIKCGQHFQQNAIDKAKGIIAKPMPKYWYDYSSCLKAGENTSVVAEKKPYFMRYIYPDLKKRYDTYIKNTNKKALREFRMTVEELLSKNKDSLTEDERNFIEYYYTKMPIGINNCVMNRICKRIEEEFDGYMSKHKTDSEFDYKIMRGDFQYTNYQYNAVKKIYQEYNKQVQDYKKHMQKERIDEYDASDMRQIMIEGFVSKCFEVCSNADKLCDILLDLLYTSERSKQFVWDVTGDVIINNLLKNNKQCFLFPCKDLHGQIAFAGEKFSMSKKEVKVIE